MLPVVILPSETKNREFDAKMLLACCLAERGMAVVVGSRVDIHNRIADFPRSVYLAKDFRRPSNRIFRILRGLGHCIVAWDEEGLIFFNSAVYNERRVHAETMEMVDEFFAWGQKSAELAQMAPGYRGQPIHVFGNPRIDLLRPELRKFYIKDVEQIRARFGKFILVNTNFGLLNHTLESHVVRPGGHDRSVGQKMSSFMEESWRHRLRIFEEFVSLVPALAAQFPLLQVVVRPHPSESEMKWKEAARGCPNVHVIQEGGAQKWILASEVLIHGTCTTGIESWVLEHPVISYRPYVSDPYDHELATSLSVQAFSRDELFRQIQAVLQTNGGTERRVSSSLPDKYLAALVGPMASDRIADRIKSVHSQLISRHNVSPYSQALARLHSAARRLHRVVVSGIKGHKNSAQYSERRFPSTPLAEAAEIKERLSLVLGRFEEVQLTEHAKNIFWVLPR